MQAKYTPGPWRISPNQSVRRPALILGQSDAIVAATEWDMELMDDGEEENANAKLISAAPDMAEALNGLLASVDVQRLYGIGLLKTEWKRGMDALQKAGL